MRYLQVTTQYAMQPWEQGQEPQETIIGIVTSRRHFDENSMEMING
jgi:hypothetical protein